MTRVRVERILCDNPDCVVYVDELVREEPDDVDVELVEHVVEIGWTQVDGRPFYVRQMRNMKGSIPTEWLSGEPFKFFSWAYGVLLARAHARTGDAAVISGYLGGSQAYDAAIAEWAEAYGDQTERDHAALVKAIKSGRVQATNNV